MKWMGWSYFDFLEAPTEITTEIVRMINEQAAEMEKLNAH